MPALNSFAQYSYATRTLIAFSIPSMIGYNLLYAIKYYMIITQKKFFQALTRLPYIEKIILYGSRARGDARERSDIDLAIVAPQALTSDWLVVVDILDDADTLLKIDGIRYDALPINSALKKAIDIEGVVLHDSKHCQ